MSKATALQEKIKKTPVTQAIVTNVQLHDGTVTQVITLFNLKTIDPDNLQYGIKTALQENNNARAMKSEFYDLNTGEMWMEDSQPVLLNHLKSV